MPLLEKVRRAQSNKEELACGGALRWSKVSMKSKLSVSEPDMTAVVTDSLELKYSSQNNYADNSQNQPRLPPGTQLNVLNHSLERK